MWGWVGEWVGYIQVTAANGDVQKISQVPGNEVTEVGSVHVGSGKQTWVVFKSSKNS